MARFRAYAPDIQIFIALFSFQIGRLEHKIWIFKDQKKIRRTCLLLRSSSFIHHPSHHLSFTMEDFTLGDVQKLCIAILEVIWPLGLICNKIKFLYIGVLFTEIHPSSLRTLGYVCKDFITFLFTSSPIHVTSFVFHVTWELTSKIDWKNIPSL